MPAIPLRVGVLAANRTLPSWNIQVRAEKQYNKLSEILSVLCDQCIGEKTEQGGKMPVQKVKNIVVQRW